MIGWEILMLSPLVFLDTETTGLSMRNDRIIEIGLLRVENDQVVETFQTLLNPQTYVSPFITQITNISSEDLEHAPVFTDIASQLLELLDGATLVAHNARFDYGFLRNEFLHAGRKFSIKQLCTAKLSRYLFPQYQRHNLDSIIERCGFTVENRHRAFDDAQVLWNFYQYLQKKFSEENLQKAIQYVQKHPSLPSSVSFSFIKNVPESPGVYIFYDQQNTPLYVGKSVNLKDRILSHFASDVKVSKEMHLSRQVHSIETIPTAGELGALLKESELIKSLQPIYNKKLRAARRLIVLKEKKNAAGYTEVVLEELTDIDPLETQSIITTSKSKKQAKEYLHMLKEEYALCEKLLGLEKAKASYFSYRLGLCKGACIGKENSLIYNARYIIAFSKNKIKPWPFNGPIILSEEDPYGKTKEEFWVDKWCLLGKRKSDEYASTDFSVSDYRFDMDTYKILFSMLSKNKKIKITSISSPAKYTLA